MAKNEPSRALPPVVARADGVPIYAYGDIFINGLCPDFQVDALLQEGNRRETAKIEPKKSWEIEDNMVGLVPIRTPCSPSTDFRPYIAINLIDGDPETLWCSRFQTQPDVEPTWIRLDLPQETVIREVVLTPRKDGQGVPVGLSIRASRDAWHWETVYENKSQPPAENGQPIRLAFEPVLAKQIWIVGSKCRPIHIDYVGYSNAGGYGFSLAEVEVLDEKGGNVALASRGTGVTVSSTNYGTANRNEVNKMLWPTAFDIGAKWIRIMGADYLDASEPLQWHMVEQEKGKYHIDPVADASVTELVENGCQVILVMFTGNWLYAPEPQDSSSKGSSCVYDVSPAPLPINPEARAAFKNFVRFMVRHFKDRIRYYEIGNEAFAPAYWQTLGEPSAERFCELVKEVAPIIREEDQDAKVVLGSGVIPIGSHSAWNNWLKECIDEQVCEFVDVIAWHPFYEEDLDAPIYRHYPRIVADFKSYAAEHGFTGQYMATESNWSAPYPYPGVPGRKPLTEIEKAKNMARAFMMHIGLGVPFFWCPAQDGALFNAFGCNCDAGLFRNTFSADPQSPVTPQPAYYVLRNICTLMDGAEPAELEVSIETGTYVYKRTGADEESQWKEGEQGQDVPTTILGGKIQEFDNYNFNCPNGDLLVAVWLPGQGADQRSALKAHVIVEDVKVTKVTGIDTLNGVEQELNWERQGERAIIPDVLVRDYPLLLRLERKA